MDQAGFILGAGESVCKSVCCTMECIRFKNGPNPTLISIRAWAELRTDLTHYMVNAPNSKGKKHSEQILN